MAYASITVEGGLFPSDLLDRIATGDAAGQREKDFGGDGGRLSDEIQSAFSDMRSFWDAFQRRLQHSGESRTTITRESWVVPLLERLGYKDGGNTVILWRPAPQIDGVTYAISHRAGEDPEAPPVHVAGVDQSLDRKAEGARRSPHATVQEFLNRAPALWGIVTNGKVLRVLRDTQLVSRPTYLEFDLAAMVESNLYSEFTLLYRLIHRTRLPADGADPNECLLETCYQQGLEEGGRVREHLREGVEAALEGMGTALLSHPRSEQLREALRSGRLDAVGYYRQLLRLIYRLLFLMVVEERKLLFPPGTENADRQQIYSEYYSMARLRDRAERRFSNDRFSDLWEGLLQTFLVFRDGDLARPLGLAALNGELFGGSVCQDIEGAACENRSLLSAVYRLSTFQDGKVRRRVNYAGLDVEELGSVYESLLELHPRIDFEPAPRFTFVHGGERKQTGSYYTPPQLVRELIESALVPVITDRLAEAGAARSSVATPADIQSAQEQALLSLRVVDPASGSGHFLLAAARRIARELAKVRSGEEEPAPEAYRQALRDVIRCCVYAVDRNPLAVDLCKVALWIEGYSAGMPLSFLDHHIKHGDSLVGVFDLEALPEIPEGAYMPVTGDDKSAAGKLKKRNREERQRLVRNAERGWQPMFQTSLLAGAGADLTEMAKSFRALGLAEERTPYDVHSKEEAYARLRGAGSDWWRDKVACDLWTAAFFLPMQPAAEAPTTGTIRDVLQTKGAHGELVEQAVGYSGTHPFFHWPVEFPDVFERGGFDVVLGNPPWEQLQPEEIEFFGAAGRQDIAGLPGTTRKAIIDRLPQTDPSLAGRWRAHVRNIEGEGKFIRGSDRFGRTAVGKLNTYSVFAELAQRLVGPTGRAGIIVPTGIATDDTTKIFFGNLMGSRSLASLYDFENKNVFPAVDSRMKFCLLTTSGTARPVNAADFAFFLHGTDELRDEERRFTLTAEDMALLNPNTRTCPIFRSRRDAEITKAIYQRVPVLIREGEPEENLWGVYFRQGLFNMTSDSHLFRTRAQLEEQDWLLEGNTFRRGDHAYLPLYEAKMLHQFDHRWATHDGTESRDMTVTEKADPACVALPRYWVPQRDVEERLAGRWDRGWLLASRMMAPSTNERTWIGTPLPADGLGNSAAIWLLAAETLDAVSALVANINAFAPDFAVRQKVGGSNLNFFYVKQFPVLPPAIYEQSAPWCAAESISVWMSRRVLPLVYTAWDMRPFALDLGFDGPPFPWDEEMRFLLRCELDAAFFHLYGIERADVEYIMDTFNIVKRKDEAKHGEYRTKRVILEIYDAITRAVETGVPYRSPVLPDSDTTSTAVSG